jgi:hypothetical protein
VPDTVLRVKRPREQDPAANSASKSRRREAVPAKTASRSRSGDYVAPEDTNGRSHRRRVAAQPAESGGRSTRRGAAAVSYAEVDSDQGEEEDLDEGFAEHGEEGSDDSEGQESSSDARSDSEDSAPQRRSSRHTAPRQKSSGKHKNGKSRRGDPHGARARPTRSSRMAVESEGSASDDNSRGSEVSDASDSGEEEEEVTTRSRRVVKTPANFAAETAATQREEHDRQQALRSARRREVQRSPDPTSGSRNGARLNPSQRYQQAERERQLEAAAAAADQSRSQRHGRQLAAHYGAASSTSHASHHAAHTTSAPAAESLSRSASSSARRLDPEVKRLMLQVVDHADELDAEYNIFAEPVTEDVAPGYFQIIQHPVDLRSIRYSCMTCLQCANSSKPF